jgi:hypothetical protein
MKEQTGQVGRDTRTPSPPLGYSRECHYDRDTQIRIVAQFHAHRIRPARIAYRVGIVIALIEALIAGEEEADRFAALVARFRRQRHRERLGALDRDRGARRFEAEMRIVREFEQERDL